MSAAARKPRRAPLDRNGRSREQRAVLARIASATRLGQIEMASANINGAIRHLAPVVAPELIGRPLSAAYRHIEFARVISRAAREILLPSLPDGLERLHRTNIEVYALDDAFLWATMRDERAWAYMDLFLSCPTLDDPGVYFPGVDETDTFIRTLRVHALIAERASADNMTTAEVEAMVSRSQSIIAVDDPRFLGLHNRYPETQ